MNNLEAQSTAIHIFSFNGNAFAFCTETWYFKFLPFKKYHFFLVGNLWKFVQIFKIQHNHKCIQTDNLNKNVKIEKQTPDEMMTS